MKSAQPLGPLQALSNNRAVMAIAAIAAAASSLAVAQVRVPTEADLQRELLRQRSTLNEQQLKDDAIGMARGSVLTPPRTGPKISDREIREAAGDPAQLANLFNEQQRGETHQDASPVMMFASTSMPRESLLSMARASKRAGVPIYIRGLPHGMTGPGLRRSLEALRPYVEAGADLQVHPEMFSYYKVRAVPAVVVTSQPKMGCTDASCAASYVKVVGDVSLQYALDQVAPRTDEIGLAARKVLARANRP
jgi:conjugal transfer pilus assembly protein TrbC